MRTPYLLRNVQGTLLIQWLCVAIAWLCYTLGVGGEHMTETAHNGLVHYKVEPGRPAPSGPRLPAKVSTFPSTRPMRPASSFYFSIVTIKTPHRKIFSLSPEVNRTYYYWHHFIPGLKAGAIYAYRAYGPYLPEEGLLFNPSKVLLDPYTGAVAYGDNWQRADAYGYDDNTRSALKSLVVDYTTYDWEGDRPLQRAIETTVIYEVHVRGFTRDASAAVSSPGTYRGVIEKIPYLKSLGITAVELLPVQQFDPQEVERSNPITGEPLTNYWGYAPVAYFAPHQGYACTPGGTAVVDEVRDMVKALHKAGIEVILDVVFNHTAEGDENGPTISFRGLENSTYYMLTEDQREYLDFTGCANTVNANHSIVRRLIRDCLRHWVQTYHIDGFRFDLASALSRDSQGRPITDSPILWEIESIPCWPAPSSSPRPGMLRGSTSWAGSPATVGRSGTAGSVTTSVASSGRSGDGARSGMAHDRQFRSVPEKGQLHLSPQHQFRYRP